MQVYVAYTEGMNFRKALADLLGLQAGASIGASLQCIRQLLDRQAAPSVLVACLAASERTQSQHEHILPTLVA